MRIRAAPIANKCSRGTARGREAGVRASVTEWEVHDDKIFVGLRVIRPMAADDQAGESDRWQVLTVRGGRIIDIRGFDDRDEAARRAAAQV